MKSSTTYIVVAFIIAFAVLLVVPLWAVLGVLGAEGHGGHAVSEIMTRDVFAWNVNEQQEKYGLPDGSVQFTDGGEIYIMAQQFSFSPQVIRVETGKKYQLNFYAPDVLHGVSLVQVDSQGLLRSQNLSYVLPPGPVTTITFTADLPGEILMLCTEYCGVGHHLMSAKLVVEGEPFPMTMIPWYQRIRVPQLSVSHWVYHDLLNRQLIAQNLELVYDPLPERSGFFMAPHAGWKYWHFHGLTEDETLYCQAADMADGRGDGQIAPGTPGVPAEFIEHFNLPTEETKLCSKR